MDAGNRGSSFATLSKLLLSMVGTGLLVPLISSLLLSAPFIPGQFLLNQHLFHLQLTAKYPATPQDQHFRGLVFIGATLTLTSLQGIHCRFPIPYSFRGRPGVSSPIGGTVSGTVSSVNAGQAYQPVPFRSGLIKSVPYNPIPSDWGRPRPRNPPLSRPYGILSLFLTTSKASVSLQGSPFRTSPLTSSLRIASIKASANSA
ncbi:unnamed protein product [Acanthosepion pharaonis]|uniref:Uncharacterized protein n=1 Tax=Acanthosepion pharaonis TaxID=158019 RepID=A0A812B7B6_ACAPH|nr:unnamed protein product [Sepia pharaonis]